jgi:lipase chaperone LimK
MAAAVAIWHGASSPVEGDAVTPPAPVATPAPASRQPAVAPAAPAAAVAPNAHRVAELLKQGSLRDTEADGDWGRWAGDALQPSHSLRRRFDYLLTGLGEVHEGALRAWIAEQVGALHGPAGAAQVLAVWERYLALLKTETGGRIDPADTKRSMRAIAERSAPRNATLGAAWAHAFFADDEAEARAFIERRSAAREASSTSADAMALITPSPATSTAEQTRQREADRIAAFGTEGAERLRAEEASWAAWQQRLDAARERQRAIGADPQLSEVQRAQARDDDLARAFNGTELIRARGLFQADGR